MKTFSLEEVAAQVLPAEWKDPVGWLQRHLRRGEISGYKLGHTWRMTEADVEALIDRHRNRPGAPAAPPRPLSFTRTSSRGVAS